MSLIMRILGSIALHALALTTAFLALNPLSIPPQRQLAPLLIEVKSDRDAKTKKLSAAGDSSKYSLDLRPSFVKGGTFAARPTAPSNGQPRLSNGDAQDFMFVEGKVMRVFDHLALKINRHLDYPDMLIENDIQGVATLDLYFDSQGNVNEDKSTIIGGHRMIRGLLTKAARKGLVDWYHSDASRLEKDKYKNQHFRADFELSFFLQRASELNKLNEGSYQFLRRRQAHACLKLESRDGDYTAKIDMGCAAMRLAGAIKRRTSSSYRGRFDALTDLLETYDERGLQGINAEI